MRPLQLTLLCAALLTTSPAAAAAPEVIVSIKPLHGLVAAVMDGIGAPRLLLDGNASPHAYSLKPSDARALGHAKLIFVVGGGLEAFLDKPLTTLGRAKLVVMSDAPAVERLPLRQGGLWEDDGHDHGDHDSHAAERFDPHLWLSPANAKAFLDTAADALAQMDAENAVAYRRNAHAAKAAVDVLDAELAQALEPVRGTPYLVFHDAYHYLEDHYRLAPAGAVTISPDRQPGARRVAEIRQRIQSGGVACVFREPQFSPRLIDRLAGPAVRVGVLDPLGADVPPGKNAWFELMRRLAASIRGCLSG